MDDSKIVEIYSAANAIEAYAIVNALETAGVKARVVGEFCLEAAGGLPLGQPITPKIWVRKEEEARARKLLEAYEIQAENTSEMPESEEPDAEEPESEEIAETSEEPSTQTTASNRGFISPLLVIAGIVCISMGIFHAIQNHKLLDRYTQTVQGEYVGYNFNEVTQKWRLSYEYAVNDVWRSTTIERENYPGRYITIRFNPSNPAESRADPILHPAWCLVLGGIFGGFALFLAYQFRT